MEIRKVEEADADEMRSFVGKKGNRRWLWHAIDHKTGEVPAYTFGDHRDDVFLRLKRLLEPFCDFRYGLKICKPTNSGFTVFA